MGLLEGIGYALAGGAVGAGKAAQDTFSEQLKQDALSAREVNLLRIQNLFAKEGRQETMAHAEKMADKTIAAQEGREVRTNAWAETREINRQEHEERQAAQLARTTAKAKDDLYVGQGEDNVALKASELAEYRAANGGKSPPGFKIFPQIELEIKQQAANTAEQRADSDERRIDALAKLYEAKAGAPAEKPLTANQKLVAEARTYAVLAKAEEEAKKSGEGRVSDAVLSGINAVRQSLDLPELVATQVEVKAKEKGFFSDTPAVTAWRYVPASEAAGGTAAGGGPSVRERAIAEAAAKKTTKPEAGGIVGREMAKPPGRAAKALGATGVRTSRVGGKEQFIASDEDVERARLGLPPLPK